MSYFVYILQSEKDQGYYIGFTQDLTKRLRGHNLGINHATKSRRPFNLVYFEKFENKTDALKREN